MPETEIDLTGGRLAAKNLIRRLVPSQIRLTVSIYDRKTRRYIAIPGYKGTIPIETRGELLKLWKAIREAVEAQGWRTDESARGTASSVRPAGAADEDATE